MGDYKEPFKKFKPYLGIGGFATTWKARVLDPYLIKKWGVQEVAIKIPLSKEKERILKEEVTRNIELRLQLTKEESVNIVGYLDFEVFEGSLVMVMKYIKEGSLRKIIGGIGDWRRMELDRAVRIIRGVLNGLSIIHSKHIVHRDIKPENILMDGEIPKIADFGISKMLNTNELASTTVGTLYYMSPEALCEKSTFNTDIWSVGIAFYEILCGQFPFGIDKETPPGMVMKLIDNDNVKLEFPASVDIPVPLQHIISKALVRNQKKRYQTADEMLNDLRKYYKDDDDIYIDRCGDEIRELFNAGKIKEAEERWKEVVKKYPQNPASYLGLGEFYNKCLQYKEAIQVFRKGIQHCPECALLYRDLALSLNAMNLKGEAINAMKKAKDLGLEKRLQKQAEDILKRWEDK